MLTNYELTSFLKFIHFNYVLAITLQCSHTIAAPILTKKNACFCWYIVFHIHKSRVDSFDLYIGIKIPNSIVTFPLVRR